MSEYLAAALRSHNADHLAQVVLCSDRADHIQSVGAAAPAPLVGQSLATALPQLAPILARAPSARLAEHLQDGDLLISYSPLWAGDGAFAGSLVSVRLAGPAATAAEVELLRAQLREREEELKAIFDSSYDELYVTDRNGVTLRVSRTCEQTYGLSRDEIIGRRVTDLQAEGLFDTVVTPRVVAERRPVTVVQVTRNGRQMLATGNPVFDARGRVVRVVTNSRDLTELLALQREIEQTKKQMSRYEVQAQLSSELLRGGMVAQSRSVLKVLEVARRVAKVDVGVLILGETGTGKNVLARYIHQMSPRARQPFVETNCAAIPETLLESELFGYERGAFTGSRDQGKPGMFEVASGGTLVLDEIGELPLNLQVKLLQFLQEGEFFRLGGARPVKVNTRIIAITNRNLAEMVARGTFREDLFYRLNIVPIRVPPLRERSHDIPLLIDRMLQRLNEKYDCVRHLTPDTVTFLMRYHWPGNVRQLEHVLEFLYIFCQNQVVTREDLPEDLLAPGQHAGACAVSLALDGRTLDQLLDAAERTVLEEALRTARSTRELGKLLGISQSSAVRKLHKHRLGADLHDFEAEMTQP